MANRPSLVAALLFYEVELPEGVTEVSASNSRQKHPLRLIFSTPATLPFPNDYPAKYCLPKGLQVSSSRVPVHSFSFIIPPFANMTDSYNASCVIIHQKKKIEEKNVYMPYAFVAISRLSLRSSLEDILIGLVVNSTGKTPEQIVDLIDRIMEYHPMDGSVNVVYDKEENHILKINTPTHAPHYDCPTHVIGQILDANNMLTILHHLLLERPIIMISSQRSLLNLVGSSLLLFLQPFKWNFPYVPISCTSDVDRFLRDAKVQTFIIGLCANDEQHRSYRGERPLIAEVYIDENRLIMPHPQPRPLPPAFRKPLYESIRKSFHPDLAFFDLVLPEEYEPKFKLDYFLHSLTDFYCELLRDFEKYTIKISFSNLESDLQSISFKAAEVKELQEKCTGIIFQKYKFLQEKPHLEAILPAFVETRMFKAYITDKILRASKGESVSYLPTKPEKTVAYDVNHYGMFGLTWATIGNKDDFANFKSLQKIFEKRDTRLVEDVAETESERDVTQTSISGFDQDEAFQYTMQHTLNILAGADMLEEEFTKLCRLLLHKHMRVVCLLIIKAASNHEAFSVLEDNTAIILSEVLAFLLDVCQRERVGDSNLNT
eukprot:TRINITY_DN8223_c0_g1_i1.p1 TRINITY_DN8223_c0_g1~~TRINITY_DN8223_c0_g1_i1.p1  ORF type:complete len:602 (+),score=114.61 TRINITY_DN8223_c0_g1_i1:53-1858(+)